MNQDEKILKWAGWEYLYIGKNGWKSPNCKWYSGTADEILSDLNVLTEIVERKKISLLIEFDTKRYKQHGSPTWLVDAVDTLIEPIIDKSLVEALKSALSKLAEMEEK